MDWARLTVPLIMSAVLWVLVVGIFWDSYAKKKVTAACFTFAIVFWTCTLGSYPLLMVLYPEINWERNLPWVPHRAGGSAHGWDVLFTWFVGWLLVFALVLRLIWPKQSGKSSGPDSK